MTTMTVRQQNPVPAVLPTTIGICTLPAALILGLLFVLGQPFHGRLSALVALIPAATVLAEALTVRAATQQALRATLRQAQALDPGPRPDAKAHLLTHPPPPRCPPPWAVVCPITGGRAGRHPQRRATAPMAPPPSPPSGSTAPEHHLRLTLDAAQSGTGRACSRSLARRRLCTPRDLLSAG
jgi:hypothetical protein